MGRGLQGGSPVLHQEGEEVGLGVRPEPTQCVVLEAGVQPQHMLRLLGDLHQGPCNGDRGYGHVPG